MAIVFTDDTHRRDKLFGLIKRHMPHVDLRLWPDIGNPDNIDYAISWKPVPYSLQNLPNLKVLFLTSAGVDAALCDPTLPNIPIVRCVNNSLSTDMAEYVVYHVIKYHRHFYLFDQQKTTQTWNQVYYKPASTCTIGMMGIGEMGQACLNALKPFGFTLRGWSRTPKHIDDVTSFAGMDQLPDFLSGCDIVVCVLPLTDETRGILCTENLQHLPTGSFLINAARGDHMVEQDIIALLDNGHLAGATLDVFPTEPLPADNPLWSHPHVTVTPHIASITDYALLCADIQAQITAFENGEPLKHVVDTKRGY